MRRTTSYAARKERERARGEREIGTGTNTQDRVDKSVQELIESQKDRAVAPSLPITHVIFDAAPFSRSSRCKSSMEADPSAEPCS